MATTISSNEITVSLSRVGAQGPAGTVSSATIEAVVDSDYINARATNNLDSAEVEALVDSDYVQLRQDYAYSSLTGAPTNVSSFSNDANYLDSDTATLLIDSDYINARATNNLDSAEVTALVDSNYVQARQDYAYSSLTGAPTSAADLVDSDYVNDRVARTNYYVKAAEAIAKGDVVMFGGVQGDHVLAKKADHSASGFIPEWIMGISAQALATNDWGQVVGFGRLESVNTSTFTNGDLLWSDPSTAGALTTTEPSAPDHKILIAAVLRAQNDGVLQVRMTHSPDTDEVEEGSTNLYYTDTRARSSISVTDAGGDGSLSYASGTGVLTYTGPSATETRAHFSAGTGVTLTSGEIAIGQAVDTTDDVSFQNITVTGDLTVNGTTTTVNSQVYTVDDPLFHLANDNETSDVVDIGFVGHYSDDGGTTKKHAGIFRDASDEKFRFFNGLVDAALDSSVPANVVNTSGTGYTVATLVGNLEGDVTGDVTGNADTATTLSGLTSTVAELNYSDGVTSNIQTQLDAKQATLTGATSDVTSTNLTAGRVVTTNASGKIYANPVTDIQLGYLLNATGNIQSQIDAANLVVTDTSPQLGGDLDVNGNNIDFGTSSGSTDDRLTFNTDDMQIYSDGTYAYIDCNGLAGSLQIHNSGGLHHYRDDGTTPIFIAGTTQTRLFYNHNEKLATESYGVDVTGTIALNGTQISATAAELNTLDGITATTTELNLLDGVTATTTELNYTDGVTSNIQTQLDGKQDTALGINDQTGTSYTGVAGDAGYIITMNNASANTFTIPANASVAYDVGTVLYIVQKGAGQTTIAITSDTLSYPSTFNAKTAEQYSVVAAMKISSTTWILGGDLEVA